MAELLDSNNAGGSFVLKASLSGMPPDACLHAALPADYAQGTVSGLLDRVFPADAEGRQRVQEHFDLRANPYLPEIYEVFLAVCDEWRDWRCALLVSAGGRAAALDAAASRLLDAREPPVLALHIEQEYRPLEYAVRHGFWESREGLLDWMRSLTVLYFLDKHEARLTASGEPPALAPSLDKALASLESQGIIAPQQPADAADGELAV